MFLTYPYFLRNGNLDVGERVRLFYHLYSFLMRWDRDSLLIPYESLQDSNSIGKTISLRLESSSESSENCQILQKISALAADFPDFPDDIFGGKEDPICCTVRQMFGFPAH